MNSLPNRSDKDDNILIKTSNNIREVFPSDSANNAIGITDTAQEKKAKLARTIINAIQVNKSGGLKPGDNISELVNDAGYSAGATIQNIGTLAAKTLPDSVTVNLANGSIVMGHLGANTVLTLTGASAGDSGLILLGNGSGHDGVGYTVSFFISDVGQHYNFDSHTVVNGDLADFSAAPGAGEYNFGTIGWFYDGVTYYLYVSEVKPYQDILNLPA